MNCQKIQFEYDKIYSYFRTTCEPFNFLDWNGKILNVWSDNQIVEVYKYKDLKALNIFKT
jgi:hypothetical protein